MLKNSDYNSLLYMLMKTKMFFWNNFTAFGEFFTGTGDHRRWLLWIFWRA